VEPRARSASSSTDPGLALTIAAGDPWNALLSNDGAHPQQRVRADDAADQPAGPAGTGVGKNVPVTDLGPLAGRAFAAVIFDMDGTLIDSTPAVTRSWRTWAIEHGIAPEAVLFHHGVPAAGVVSTVLPEHQHERGLARINELELADVGDIELLPGAREALDSLARAPRAIATSCTRPLAAARLRASGIVRPPVLITADDVERGKPSPDPFLAAARGLGVDPTSCLVVEDAPAGVQAARAAGCAVLAVATTVGAEQLASADSVVSDLTAVRFVATSGGIRLEPA
jgi:mannitol-1-/sugar-/sorbitol-6-phosphatase